MAKHDGSASTMMLGLQEMHDGHQDNQMQSNSMVDVC
jgi:hypothetical protein